MVFIIYLFIDKMIKYGDINILNTVEYKKQLSECVCAPRNPNLTGDDWGLIMMIPRLASRLYNILPQHSVIPNFP